MITWKHFPKAEYNKNHTVFETPSFPERIWTTLACCTPDALSSAFWAVTVSCLYHFTSRNALNRREAAERFSFCV